MTKPLRMSIEIVAGLLPKTGRVLEIGSRQEKNQKDVANLRKLFPQSEYVGVDMRSGPGVDKVANAEKLPFEDSSFDVVLCLETLEHAERPWLISEEIERVTKNNGVMIVSSQQNFPIHMHPSDYFRFTPYGLRSLFKKLKSSLLIGVSPAFEDEAKLNPQMVLMVGWKRKSDLGRKIKRELLKKEEIVSGHKPYRHRVRDGWKWIRRGVWEAKFRQKIEFF